MRIRAVAVALAGCTLAVFGAEPSLVLRLDGGPAIPVGAAARAGLDDASTFDLVLSGAPARIDLDTVVLTLNGHSIVGFARKGNTDAGIRIFIDRAGIRHPHLALSDENRLRFSARDEDGNRYNGEFVVHVSEGVRGVTEISVPGQPPSIVEGPDTPAQPPVIAFTSDPTVPRGDRSWRLLAEVRATTGIRAVSLDLNWKQFERIELLGGLPTRRRGRFHKPGRLPGTVTGHGRHLVLDIPVPLGKRETRVELRATTIAGVEASAHVTVRRSR